jgi:predicted kinase
MPTPTDRVLFYTVGLPASGKSTYVQNVLLPYAHRRFDKVLLVCPDNIREELAGNWADQTRNNYIFDEHIPKMIEDFVQSLKEGESAIVVWDATNLNVKSRQKIRELAKFHSFGVLAKGFDTSLEECLIRNSARDHVVPEGVIKRMHRNLQPIGRDEVEFFHPKIALSDTEVVI